MSRGISWYKEGEKVEKYRQSQKRCSLIVLSSFFLLCFFSVLSVEVDFSRSNVFVSYLHSDAEYIEYCMDFKKLNERAAETGINDIAKNVIKHPMIKRDKIEDWRLFFLIALHIIAVLPVVSTKRCYHKLIFLCHQWEMIQYIQDKDGKKRQFLIGKFV